MLMPATRGEIFSVTWAICDIVRTVTTGISHRSLPLSITASVPSKMALATSLTSARVEKNLDHRLKHLRGDDDGFAGDLATATRSSE